MNSLISSVGLMFFAFSSANSACSTPSIPEGGFFLTCGTVTGAVCQFRCRSSDKTLQKKCSESGTWVGDEFSCSDSSDSCTTKLKAPANGLIIGDCSTKIGSVCNFMCNSDYKLVGSAQVYCIGTVWSSEEPNCVKTTEKNGTTGKCPALRSNADGYIEGSCYQGAPVGSICYFGCSTGYTIYGSSSAICLATGKWSSNPPLCIKSSTKNPDGPKTTPSPPKTTAATKKPNSCKSVQEITKGKLRGSCQPGVVGATCTVSCSYGYYLTNGSSTITCQNNGQWSGSLGLCNRVKYYLVRTWYW